MILMCVMGSGLVAQPGNGFHQYFYPDGKVSSEGTLVDGKPEGWWKTFYENGELKSQGKRTQFLLDSTWFFYTPEGALESTIAYRNGKKNGALKKYADSVLVSDEQYVADVKQGPTTTYYPDGKTKSVVVFKDGKEDGKAYEYAEDGRPITISAWRSGVLQRREQVNRLDGQGWRQGTWQGYYPNGKLKWEGNYVDDKRQGIFKEYDAQGNLKNMEKYDLDVVLPDAEEATLLQLRNTYHANGKVASIGSYSKDGKKEGLFREFNDLGRPTDAAIYRNGVLMSQGAVSEAGALNGPWTEYYATGEKRAEGSYLDGKKDGPWTFFHRGGEVEQRGNYKDGLPQGVWKWFYATGELHREENYRKGREDGESAEYEKDGSVIVKGQYIDGKKDGPWIYHVGGHTEQGSYKDGERDGPWTSLYDDGKKFFTGSFIAGERNGKQRWYWPNGRLKLQGKYTAGLQQGDFNYFDNYGTLLLTIRYKDGKEMKLNDAKLPAPFEPGGYVP